MNTEFGLTVLVDVGQFLCFKQSHHKTDKSNFKRIIFFFWMAGQLLVHGGLLPSSSQIHLSKLAQGRRNALLSPIFFHDAQVSLTSQVAQSCLLSVASVQSWSQIALNVFFLFLSTYLVHICKLLASSHTCKKKICVKKTYWLKLEIWNWDTKAKKRSQSCWPNASTPSSVIGLTCWSVLLLLRRHATSVHMG